MSEPHLRAGLMGAPADTGAARRARVIVGLSLFCFLMIAPFAKHPLPQFPAFIGFYQSTLFIIDLTTASLLWAQFRASHSVALLMLICGYVRTAIMAVIHMVTFPGLFTQGGLLAAGPQTTAWLYIFWHGVFPVFVLAYGVLRTRAQPMSATKRRWAVMVSAAGVIALLIAFTSIATSGAWRLPPIMEGNVYAPAMMKVVGGVWCLSLAALMVLFLQGTARSPLDLWLMVALCAWLFDIALSAGLNHGRYDLGFYAGRTYGLLAMSVVLASLLAEQHRLYTRLVDAYAEAHAASQSKDIFLAMVAHELKNPLGAVRNALHVLSRLPTQDPLAAESVKAAARQTERLVRLVDDLLDTGRIVSGKLELRQASHDLGQLAVEWLNTQKNTGRLDQHTVSVAVHEKVWIRADRQRIEQVFSNLLANAVKYTPAGGRIRIEVRREGEEGVLELCDNGVGMSEDIASRVFDRFYQAPNTLDRAQGGLGIGLAVVQAVTQLHGGRVDVRTDGPGKGSCFTVRLPALPAEVESESPRTDPPTQQSGS